jgi:hypothetical protein
VTAIGLAVIAGLFGWIFRVALFTQRYRAYMISQGFPPAVVPSWFALAVGMFGLAWGALITTYKREHALLDYTSSVFWRVIAWGGKFFAAILWVGFGAAITQNGLRIATVDELVVIFSILCVMLFITEMSFDHLYTTSGA